LASKRVVLVLGGGGMRGMAHVGVWRAIVEAGIPVTEIIGVSIGALVGASIAGGTPADQLRMQALALQKSDTVMLNRWALLFNGIRQQSVFRGDTFRAYIESVLPVPSFSELKIPLQVNAVAIGSGKEEWFGEHGRGDVALADAVYASCALPVFYPPVQIGAEWYMDGGIATTLPIARALACGADQVLAVDVGANPVTDPADIVEKGLVAIHHRTTQIMGYAKRQESLAWPKDADVVYIKPELQTYSTFDFANVELFIDEGYRAARAAFS